MTKKFALAAALAAVLAAVIAMAGEDFLMYVRKILFSTPETFAAENGQYDLVMRRYNIVLDVFSEFGIDLNAIATGE